MAPSVVVTLLSMMASGTAGMKFAWPFVATPSMPALGSASTLSLLSSFDVGSARCAAASGLRAEEVRAAAPPPLGQALAPGSGIRRSCSAPRSHSSRRSLPRARPPFAEPAAVPPPATLRSHPVVRPATRGATNVVRPTRGAGVGDVSADGNSTSQGPTRGVQATHPTTVQRGLGRRSGARIVVTATAAMVTSALALPSAAPSLATIAPPAPRRLGAAALLAISHWEPNRDDTQHWPEPRARTNAPGHTRTALPPGSPTSVSHWKVLPEGRASTHEDENGDAVYVASMRDKGVRRVVHGGRGEACTNFHGGGDETSGDTLFPLPAPTPLLALLVPPPVAPRLRSSPRSPPLLPLVLPSAYTYPRNLKVPELTIRTRICTPTCCGQYHCVPPTFPS